MKRTAMTTKALAVDTTVHVIGIVLLHEVLIRVLADKNLVAVIFAAGDHIPFWVILTAAGFILIRWWMLVGMLPFVVYRLIVIAGCLRTSVSARRH